MTDYTGWSREQLIQAIGLADELIALKQRMIDWQGQNIKDLNKLIDDFKKGK